MTAVPAIAATATASFQITATVSATCVVGATNLAFGTYAGVQIDSTSTLSVTCTNTTPYTVGLNVGTATNATATTRSMTLSGTLPPTLLGYALYRDSARTLNWGFTTGTDTVPGTGTGAVQPLTVYGRVPAGQFVTPGVYIDTIIATVTF